MAAWKFVGDEIFVADDDDEVDFRKFSCRFEVVEKRVDILTGKEEVAIKITNGYTNPTIIKPRSIISENFSIDFLTDYGVSVCNDKAEQKLVKHILVETEETASIKLQFSKLGFVTIGDEEAFLADRFYCAQESSLSAALHTSDEMQPHGTLEEYRKFLITEVSKSPKLALAFVLGVTAPVAHILKKHGAFYETLLWCFCGESSTGKTTSLLSMLSLYGCPQYLLNNLNATSNALAEQVAAHAGFPFVADEATRSKIDFDETIYSLSSGKSKSRCNGDGSLKKKVNFSGAAFFSSEQPILDKCTEQGGEEARVIEFECDWFDGNGAKAEKFLRFFSSNYGTATADLARLLLDPNIQDAIVKHFLKAQTRLATKVKMQDGVDKRIVQRLAIIAVSCWVLQKAIKVDFHVRDIVKVLTAVFNEKQTRICRTDGAERLIQLFVEDYIHNRDKYLVNTDAKKSSRHASFAISPSVKAMRGKVGSFKGKPCLWLPVDTFNEILDRQTTYGASTAKKKLHEKGHLEKFGNSYYRWHNFGFTSANAYCVFLPTQADIAQAFVDEEDEAPIKIEPPQMLVAGFVSLTCQQAAMVLNMELGNRLGINKTADLYLSIIGSRNSFLLDKKPSDNAIPISFEKIDDAFVSKDLNVSSIMKALGLNVSSKQRLLLTDVNILGRPPCVMVRTDNPHGQWYGDIEENYPFKISDVYPNKGTPRNSQVRSLLEEDDE